LLFDCSIGKNQSWKSLFNCNQFFKNQLSLYPKKSMVLNFGSDEGPHCFGRNRSDLREANDLFTNIKISKIEIKEN
jgi:hypothetical protein